ncbi:DUF4231 domain-containing protein [Rhizobium leguminosarum]|uniref:DUF4231 domain-containing protein n=1 Tax=Rhizobium leguminosarum TaxID=384 RepID=UPI003F955547
MKRQMRRMWTRIDCKKARVLRERNSISKKDLGGQRNWYSSKAAKFKSRTEILAISIIAAGSATSFAQLFKHDWVPFVTAALGVYVALAEGWQRISRYGETWITYRIASERMKREQRLFQTGAGTYRGLSDEDAFLRFVEAIEIIMAEEQQIYWQNRQSQGASSPAGEQTDHPPSSHQDKTWSGGTATT